MNFKKNGWYGNSIDDDVIIVGGIYDSNNKVWKYILYTDSPVKIPLKPKTMWLLTTSRIYMLPITNKSMYISILKKLIRAVIVCL